MDAKGMARRALTALCCCVLAVAFLPLAGAPVGAQPPAGVSAQAWAAIQRQLLADDGAADDWFGWEVAISGGTLIVGVPYDEVGGNDEQGSAYVFQRNWGGPNNWGLVKHLFAGDGAAGDRFGGSVAIDGDSVAVAAWGQTVGGNPRQGSAYVFYRNRGGSDNWGQVRQIVAADGAAGDIFGGSLALSGDTLVVGAAGHASGGATFRGAAYVFERNRGGADHWGQARRLLAGDGEGDDQFGFSAVIDGDVVVVGAPADDVGIEADRGSAYVFYRNQGGANRWGQVCQVFASDGAAGDWFGSWLAIRGDTLLVGAQYDDVGGNAQQGSAYLFYRNRGGADQWGQVQQLLAGDGAADDLFGYFVALGDDVAVVGAPFHDVGANADQGAAYAFYRYRGGADNWGQVQQLVNPDGLAEDRFGNTVALYGNTLVVGAAEADIAGNADQGAVYLFGTPRLWLRKWAERETLPAGWVVRYTIRVTNDTPDTLAHIRVVDTLPAGTLFVKADPAYMRSGRQVIWTLTNVPSGESRDLHVQIRTYTTQRGVIVNAATAGAGDWRASAQARTGIVAPGGASPDDAPAGEPVDSVEPSTNGGHE